MLRVLMAVRDTATRMTVQEILEPRGFAMLEAHTTAEVADAFTGVPPTLAIIEDAGRASGTADLLATVRHSEHVVPAVILVDRLAPTAARRPTSGGADVYVRKPIEPAELVTAVESIVGAHTEKGSPDLGVQMPRDPFIGTSLAIRQLAAYARKVVDSEAPLLLLGETGTGKGVIASWFHRNGPRARQPFVDINCAGLTGSFLETELFGHERGAFTGANAVKLGLLDVAHRGTVFLDEIGDIDSDVQPRLLKVLEEKRFRRLGDTRERFVDIRLIAATHRDLARASRDGGFRADLYYRLNTVALTLPPLRHRREDIPLLAHCIARELGHELRLTATAAQAIVAYDWPGNLRELRNVIERAILISHRTAPIGVEDLRFEAPASNVRDEAPEDIDCFGTLVDAERRHIIRVVKHVGGSIEQAAIRLGVARSTLYDKLRKLGISTKMP